MGFAWCVGIAQPNCEARAEANLLQQGFEPFIPKVTQRYIVGGKKLFRERPMFGRYFFIHFVDRWRSILGTRGVAGIILNGESPSLVPSFEIEALKAREQNGIIKLKKQEKFKRGTIVRVDSGELVGFQGLYEGMSSRDREIVLFNMMGRWVRTELAAGDILINAR